MEDLVSQVVESFGAGPTVTFAVLSGMSFIASILNAVWSDDNMPAWARPVIAILSGSFGKGRNDPGAQ